MKFKKKDAFFMMIKITVEIKKVVWTRNYFNKKKGQLKY